MQISINADSDISKAVQASIISAQELKFGRTQVHMIGTCVSELARNIFVHAGEGVIQINSVQRQNQNGIEIIAVDRGPGIVDIALAMRDHYSSKGSLGIGLPGTKRLMDDFEIASEPGNGTKITVKKWV